MPHAVFQRALAGAFLTLVGAAAVVAASGAGKVQATPPPRVVTCADAEKPSNVVPTPNRIDGTCAVIPLDLNGTGDTQGPADLLSWLTFVAVNWPVNPAACAPSQSASILTATPNPTWLSYLSSDDVFVPAPSTPAPWCNGNAALRAEGTRASQSAHLPAAVRALASKYFKSHPNGKLLYLHHDSKGHALAEALRLQAKLGRPNRLTATPSPLVDPAVLKEILDATNQPVVDQNGRFERFTISLNVDEYKYVTAHKLWTFAGEAATGNLNFPTQKSPGATVGAMEFKAGWKVLKPGKDVFSHFFTMPAIVYNDQAGSGPPESVTVGLVGLHIIHKTNRQHAWIWSTFEQIDNTNDGPRDANPKSFYNPSCAPASCPPNTQTAPTPYIEVRPGGKLNPPTQVVAVVTPAPSVVTLNAHFRGMLRNTPWYYYQLISTQWTGGSGPIPSPNPAHLGVVQPFQLGNPVLETYVRETFASPSPPASPMPARNSLYSCMYCHSLFMQGYYKSFSSDFSLIVNAQQ
ncbi:MAG: hypothetical protein JO036_07605 [Candidatus Eremiobacteraeota bacterium]|nr:hypothetical protein [Candidatus Eremiobacteraeota bacterium]